MSTESAQQNRSHLRTGFTTGACAAAAAKGAALMLTHQITIREVSIELPGGASATFSLSGQLYSPGQARCFVVKDAGDDPDITNGAEIHAAVSQLPNDTCGAKSVVIAGGKGIGRVTKPGLAVAPGEWAINPVPQRMITDAVLQVISPQASVQVEISIPDGEERAKKTLNARLGILGGLSILGTTGIVRPISAKAWTDTLDAALDVAKACNCCTVVLSTGRTSEMAVQNYERVKGQGSRIQQATLFDAPIPLDSDSVLLKEEAYIMMGDHIAYALKACQTRGFTAPIIACQFAKLLKIACGHENTHAAASELDLATLLGWATAANIAPAIIASIEQANTAREIAIACSFDSALLDLVFQQAAQAVARHAAGLDPHFMVADYNGDRLYHSR